MIFKKIKGHENYHIYEDGKIFNTKTNKYLNPYKTVKGLYVVGLNKKIYNLGKLIYMNYYEDELLDNNVIKYIDGNQDNLNYKNLQKSTRSENLKSIKYELDKTKKWKNINGYPDYKISNYGDIFSIRVNKILTPTKNSQNYCKVKLTNDNNVRQSFFVHRLVYDAFKKLSNNEKLVIDHIDRNPSNNYIDNLREVTYSENNKNRTDNKKDNIKIQQFTLNNEFIKEWNSIKEIKKHFNLGFIQACCNGNRKIAYNYIWKSLNIINDVSEFKEIVTDDGKKYSNYKINCDGEIINISRNNNKLKPNNVTDYSSVTLYSDDNIRKKFLIHRLVAITFIPNPNNYDIVHHIDENKLNNNIKNLQWCNHLQNITYSYGKKINQIDIETNKIIKTFDSISSACKELNKNNKGDISSVCEGKRITAFGFKWSYV